jgi:hypothetical protein
MWQSHLRETCIVLRHSQGVLNALQAQFGHTQRVALATQWLKNMRVREKDDASTTDGARNDRTIEFLDASATTASTKLKKEYCLVIDHPSLPVPWLNEACTEVAPPYTMSHPSTLLAQSSTVGEFSRPLQFMLYMYTTDDVQVCVHGKNLILHSFVIYPMTTT